MEEHKYFLHGNNLTEKEKSNQNLDFNDQSNYIRGVAFRLCGLECRIMIISHSRAICISADNCFSELTL